MDYGNRLEELVNEHADVVRRFFEENREAILLSARTVVESLSQGGKVLVFGNGGSAADASHLAAELINRFRKDRTPLPALALTTDPSVLTSIANDYGYEEVFSRQLAGLGRRGDVAVGISTSGKSASVLRAMDVARSMGLRTIGLTGSGGHAMAGGADVGLVVPSAVTARIQEVHGLYIHVLCEIAENDLFPEA